MPTQLIHIRSLWRSLPALILALATLPAYAAPQVVGHISFVKGSNAAQQPGAAPRILGNGTEIFQGDNIQTTERSFVIIEFNDGAKVTVRPDSNFTIDHYDSQSANKTAQLVLHEGAVNASTGTIAQDDPGSFQIKTPNATVKPESAKAEFQVGICDQACEERAKKEAAANAVRTEQSPVARVVEIKGNVSAINRADKNAKERPLSLGASLYNSDSISSEKESFALLLFPDGQKLTLEADSEMEIKEYNYQIKNKKDNVLLRLANGGLRALTGSIGKADHNAYTLDTPVATIGIRGSGGDTRVYGNSLTLTMWQMMMFVRTMNGQEHNVQQGQTLFLPNPYAQPQIFDTPPSAYNPNAPTRPDQNNSDPKNVFKTQPNAVRGDMRVMPLNGNIGVQNNKGETTSVEEGHIGSTNQEGDTTTSPIDSDDTSQNNDNNQHFNNQDINNDLFNNPTDGPPDGC